jgi:hypothetical protein
MVDEERRGKSFAAKLAWPLLVLTAMIQAYLGLSEVAYIFMGAGYPSTGRGGWIAAIFGGFQAVAAGAAILLAARRDLRRTTLAVAASILLGWLSTVPATIEYRFDFSGGEKTALAIFVLSPLIAIASALLAWRNVYPIAAALIAGAMTIVGILIVFAFAIAIAIHGF